MAGYFKRYDELKINDVIIFHGGKCRVTDLKTTPYVFTEDNRIDFSNETDVVVSFTIEPEDEECVELLGNFYSHGTYGGVGCLKVWVEE